MSLLEVSDVSVRFGGNHALRGVDLGVAPGSVTGLIGPNGAGKTTLFNVITGLQDPSSGRVLLRGRDITSLPAHRRARLGIARTFQRLEVFGSLSARDNVLAAAEIRRAWARDRAADPRADTDAILDLVGVRHVADERVDAMPTGLARLVELGRALATRPEVLLLDEPASGLDETETDAFARLLLRLAGRGTAILLVEHDVQLVMRVCSLVHVLDLGSILAVGTPAAVQSDQAVLDAYLGASTGAST
jgi:branched-chain amino acid transport system ATP-binding protein